jgi:CheY-like chemotaxis protein
MVNWWYRLSTAERFGMRILIVEDKREVTTLWRLGINDANPDAEVVIAHTIEEAREAYRADPNFDLISMDGCVPGNEHNTAGLIREIRRLGYTGPLVAASDSEAYRRQMMKEGCSDDVPKGEMLAYFLRQVG